MNQEKDHGGGERKPPSVSGLVNFWAVGSAEMAVELNFLNDNMIAGKYVHCWLMCFLVSLGKNQT